LKKWINNLFIQLIKLINNKFYFILFFTPQNQRS